MTAKKAATKVSPAKSTKVLKAPAKTVTKVEKVLQADPVTSEIKELLESGVRVNAEAPQDVVPVVTVSNVIEQDDELVKEAPEVMENHKDVFLIAKTLCMTCVHLCPETGSESPTSCHYDAGNEDCPARITVIQLGMSRKEIEKAATAIVEATFNGDFERLNLASQRLSRKSESVRASVSARVLELQVLRTK